MALLIGALLRMGSLYANAQFTHGDVNVDARITESLAKGKGFWIPWEEGTVLYTDPLGSGDDWGHPSDSHAPLWPLLGAPFAWFTGDGYRALQIVSWLCGVLAIVYVRRVVRGLDTSEAGERAGVFAAWGIALSLPLCDGAGSGSFYAGQILGILLLIHWSRTFVTTMGAIRTGILLGALYLISYQSGILIPMFGACAWMALGFRKSFVPLLLAAVPCLAVAMPWFIRNYLIWGDPLFTTNPAFFGSKVGSTFVDFSSGPRPVLQISYESAAMWDQMWRWSRHNLGFVITTLFILVPGFCWFVPGGFQRILKVREAGRLRMDGLLFVASFAMLVATAVICPQARTRHVVPLIPLLVAAASVELAAGPRLLWAVAAGIFGYFSLHVVIEPTWDFYDPTFVDLNYVLCTGIAPALVLIKRFRPWVAVVALAMFALFNGARAWISTDSELLASVYGPGRNKPTATLTYYEFINDPWNEPENLTVRNDYRRAAEALYKTDVQLVISDATYSTLWNRRFLSTRGNEEFPRFERIVDFYNCDGMIIPRGYTERISTLNGWLDERKAELIYEGLVFLGYRIPRAPK